MITIEDIIIKHDILEEELKQALSTMELSGKVKEIQAAIKELQAQCPHYSAEYNWVHDGKCPYCGKKE